jgi:hypothetical protein
MSPHRVKVILEFSLEQGDRSFLDCTRRSRIRATGSVHTAFFVTAHLPRNRRTSPAA